MPLRETSKDDPIYKAGWFVVTGVRPPRPQPAAAPEPAPAPKPAPTRRALVVVVEPLMREFLAANLRAEGYEEVLEASNSEEALSALAMRRNLIELVVLDLAAPRLNGKRTLRRLRTVHKGPLAVILMSSSSVIERLVAENRDPGLHMAYMYKPFKLDPFAETVKALVAEMRRSPGTAAAGASAPDTHVCRELRPRWPGKSYRQMFSGAPQTLLAHEPHVADPAPGTEQPDESKDPGPGREKADEGST